MHYAYDAQRISIYVGQTSTLNSSGFEVQFKTRAGVLYYTAWPVGQVS
jgi:hypothetical protein